jgi:D-glycerate 3-kinase
MDAPHRRSVATSAAALVRRIREGGRRAVGVAAAPGTGKSTLCATMQHLLTLQGVPSIVIALDDYYLPLPARKQLAATAHPLFRTRGVPGTHDLDLMLGDIGRLISGDIHGLKLPLFDKSIDDRAPRAEWQAVDAPPEVLLVEGWFIGAPAQPGGELKAPVNDFERMNDPDGAWRTTVNEALGRYREGLAGVLEEFWYLSAPGWDCIVDWRWQQERELARMNLRSHAEVQAFLAHYQRIVLHMQRTHPRWASLSLETDREHFLHWPA